MNILVCVKPVPDPEKYNELKIDSKTKRLVREDVPTIVNPTDKNALEAALKLRETFGGTITVISMAPEFCRDKMTECLAMGADEAYLLSDRLFGGADTYVTSYILAEGIKRIVSDKGGKGFDLVLAGNESADGATSHVPTQVAEWLGLPHICRVTELTVTEGDEGWTAEAVKKTEKCDLVMECELPLVIAVSRDINKPRLVNAMGIIKARKKPLTIWSNDILQQDPEKIGLAGSPTQSGELITPDMARNATPLSREPEAAAKEIADIIEKAGR